MRVMRSLARVTGMPIEAAASSSSLIACSASRPMLRSTARHTHKPASQNAATIQNHTCLSENCSAPGAALAPPCRAELGVAPRSEEHTSELQSRLHLVCRLLLEKKKKKYIQRE